MAMLAEPRHRKRYNLVPRGKPLYEDDTRFGTKMLEKMGWSKGKGLGANENGSQDFVRVRYKNDAQGLGFEVRDDQWTQHEDSFQSLLKNLNDEDVEEKVSSKISAEQNDSEDDIPRVGFGFQDNSVKEETNKKSDTILKLKDRISGISLEEVSKQSRARVHYKKFTRGKDLSQYSEKDLANIFGKKHVDDAANDFYQQLSNTFSKKDELNEETKEQEKDSKGNLENGQIFTSNVSVADYFKMKMEAIKCRSAEIKMEQETLLEVQECEVSQKKKKKKKEKKEEKEVKEGTKKVEESLQEKLTNGQMYTSSMSVADYFKEKVEATKNRRNGNNNAEIKIKPETSAEVQEDKFLKKKKKNRKDKKQDQEEEMDKNIIEVEQPTNKPKKSKKRDFEEEKVSPKEETNVTTITKKEKSKKKVNKQALKPQNEVEEIPKEKPQSKKRKYEVDTPVECISNKKVNEQELKPKEKPQLKKRKNEVDTLVECIDEINLTEEPQKKKKNKAKDAEIIKILDTSTEIETIPESSTSATDKKKKKKSKTKPEFNASSGEKELPTSQQTVNEATTSNDVQKSKKNDVSSTPNQQNLTNDVLQALTLDDLKSKLKSFHIYQISSFCAEKFRNINLNEFTGSTLPQVNGYALSTDLQLEVHINKNDEERITNLWKSTLDKYSRLEKPKKTYYGYIKEVFKAKKNETKKA